MVAKAVKTSDNAQEVEASNHQHHQSRRNRTFSKPSWLLCTIADLDERMKTLTWKSPKQLSSDSFAARANSYYDERPHLLALLQDLYNNYLSLADRYCQSLAKNHDHQRHSRCPSPIPPPKFDESSQLDSIDNGEVIDSDTESSLSFQTLTPLQTKEINSDMIVADLIMKTVEYEIVASELNLAEKRLGESSRKIDLQRNLLDVLESERLILLNDNATLGYRVSALTEENKGLVSESLFLKRKAAELARCVLKAREDHRVCELSRKIEDLQGQIYGLEERNKEYYEKLVKKEKKSKLGKSVGGDWSKCFSRNAKKNGEFEGGRKVGKLWEKVKKLDLFQCSPNLNSATGC